MTYRGDDLDLVVRGGTIYDGRGGAPVEGDVAVAGDRIVSVGGVAGRGRVELDARGFAVSPGFVNMLSWARSTGRRRRPSFGGCSP